MVSLDEIEEAAQAIGSRLVRTPLVRLRPIESLPEIYFKLELFQKTGSFKIRGVLNKLRLLDGSAKQRGVITISSGNHAQAVAYGASLEGIPSTVVMPAWSDPGKVAATRAYGGDVILTQENLLEVLARVQQERGLTLVHPFDDPEVIAGSGTLGLEIVEDVPQPGLVLVGVGGGGLISGVAAAVKQKCPSARIVGVEPEGAAVMTRSLELGKPATLDKIETIADGLAAPFAGRHTLAHVQEFVDQVVTVSDDEIVASLKLLLERCKVLCEPAAAAAFIPLMRGDHTPQDNPIVCVVCGGNINLERLQRLM